MIESILNKLLDSSNYIIVFRNNIKILGANTAILLGELIAWQNYLIKEKEVNNIADYFFFRQETINDKIGLSKKIQTACIRKLEKFKLIQTKKQGVPCKTYYKLLYKNIEKLIVEGTQYLQNVDTSIYKRAIQASTNCRNIYNIYNKKIHKKKQKICDSLESQELQNKSSKKNKRELSYNRKKVYVPKKTEIEILQMMKDSGDFPTRLPQKTKNNPTKTVVRSCFLIEKIITNKFYDYLKDNNFFTKEHLYQYNTTEMEVKKILESINSYEKLQDILESNISYFKQDKQNAEQNKVKKRYEFLSKLSLERYLYDDAPKSYIKSYFIYYLFNKPKDNIDVINTKRIKQSLNKETIELAEKIKSKISEEINEYNFWNNIKSIKKWLRSNREILLYKNELQDTDCNFEIEFGTIERILKKFLEFIQNQNIQTLKVSNIGAKNRTWNNWFIPEVMKIYNLRLTITDKDMREYGRHINRKEEKREVIPFEDIPNELFENAIKRNEERRKIITA